MPVPRSCTEYSTIENEFYQKVQVYRHNSYVLAIRTRHREGLGRVRVIKTTLHALNAGRWKKKVSEDARLFSTQVRGIQIFSFLFPQNNHLPVALASLLLKKKKFPQIDKIGKERLYVDHSFIFNWSRRLILNSAAV